MTAEAPTSARKTAPNVRLVEPLKSEASAKAKSLGISLNALVSMAVRQYLDGQSGDPGRDPLVAALLAEVDKELAKAPAPQNRAPRLVPGGTIGSGRGARPIRKPRKGVYICSPRQGSRLEIFLTCSARFVPGGILGASFHVEYLRAWSYSERLWNSKGGGPALQRHTIRYGTDV
ncbi:hypothetical protein QT562_21570 [Xanthomonas citri pv. citri]|uniref:Uncharacterized protein n=2 Tax=Xanthomonas citri TaxID=346 RepID=A0A0U5BTC9_XANCI|nr:MULTISPECIES: hypothetical protein [Xanthomonas]AGH77616.1 hypothetical protein XAC29_10765 [Xanthomonas axonopodis Xac29-1]AJD68717.1 hypothetical protein J151_02290 [Xanthomonas citri subsp. citri A306]AJY82242.1 hypothetical protein J159_02278 [Xanthomonas citri pv. citri]AJY86665.1 hypothetical protein J158_02279 [Xanthomonas citri subsp. citri UI6]AJY91097.1 hypothetical protein J169_02287 [Xanthomonas citri pv. citri]